MTAHGDEGNLILTDTTRRTLVVLACLAAPSAVLATPAIAQASGGQLEFAIDSNGTQIPGSWTEHSSYYTNSGTVYFSGASANATVSLTDEDTGHTVIGQGTASQAGNGEITWDGNESVSAVSGDDLELTDAGDTASTKLSFSASNLPDVSAGGVGFDVATQQDTTGEGFVVLNAIPGEARRSLHRWTAGGGPERPTPMEGSDTATRRSRSQL